MTLEFHRIHHAINATLAYYKIGKIYDHFKILAGKDPNSDYKIESYEFVFEQHKYMENEILQIITHVQR